MLLLKPRSARLRIEIERPPDELFQFRIGPTEQNALPRRAVSRNILKKVTEKKIAFAAARRPTVTELIAPIGRYSFRLRAGLRGPCQVHQFGDAPILRVSLAAVGLPQS